jgi:hypothetical protein
LEEVDKNRIKAVAAVGVKRDNRENTDYCAVWMTAKLKVDKDERVVSMADLKVDKIAYPGVSDKVKESLGGIIKRHILKADLTMSLDRLVAMMAGLEKRKKDESSNVLENPVPEFFFSTCPANLYWRKRKITTPAMTAFHIASTGYSLRPFPLFSSSAWMMA